MIQETSSEHNCFIFSNIYQNNDQIGSGFPPTSGHMHPTSGHFGLYYSQSMIAATGAGIQPRPNPGTGKLISVLSRIIEPNPPRMFFRIGLESSRGLYSVYIKELVIPNDIKDKHTLYILVTSLLTIHKHVVSVYSGDSITYTVHLYSGYSALFTQIQHG